MELGAFSVSLAVKDIVSGLWDYAKPELSEQRFRQALATATGDEALILQTQIARTYGLRSNFIEARRILSAIEGPVRTASAEPQVRYYLELGRTYASATSRPEENTPESKARARALFTQAFHTARDASLDNLAIDALHMMAFVDSEPKDQLDWDLKALAYMEGSSQPEAKKWEGSLRNNVGYARHRFGQYDEALAQYRLSLAAHERDGRPGNARIAHWMIARTLRAQGKFQEAIVIQLRMEREWGEAGEPDSYVFEELEHLYRAVGDLPRADEYAAKLRQSKQGR